MSSAHILAVMAVCAGAAWVGDIEVCPGEGDRYKDHKCNHDATHRVCAQLLDAGQPKSWGTKGDFWQITGQKAFQWDADIRANNGDSWCICMWATASLIQSVGCENVHIRCDSTDVAYILKSYTDGGVDLEPAKTCLQQKCSHEERKMTTSRTAPEKKGDAAASLPNRKDTSVPPSSTAHEKAADAATSLAKRRVISVSVHKKFTRW
eukprot:CAMPEP_0117508968 /NCGR_PEP_ID=MMETSP0784-20121206/27229_1 /TAXON_ID=39447 /ORGANISM="" /LENGTH=206 /DNA_ID=CAMNT_0005304553 /DNA_START=75 /DNA_END=692 /DNA_ORIENTATION=-